MKKLIGYFILVLAIMTVLVGCGQSNQTSKEGKPTGADQSAQNKTSVGGLKITMAGGSSSGGLWAPIGEGIGEAIKRTLPGTTFTYAPGQDGANVITVSSGKTEIGMATAASVKWALAGNPPFNKKIENVRAIAFLHHQPYHFVVPVDSKIQSIEQIAKEKYPLVASVNTKDSPMEISNRIVLESYGTSYEQIEKNGGKIQYIAASRVNDQVKDNKIQALMSPMPAPAGSLLELDNSKPLRLLPLSEQAIKDLEDKLGCQRTVIKGGTYKFAKEDTPTVTMDTILIASADLPEDVVYNITKSLYKQMDYLHSVHNALKELNKESITQVSGVPLHPGAIKYYKEIGILK